MVDIPDPLRTHTGGRSGECPRLSPDIGLREVARRTPGAGFPVSQYLVYRSTNGSSFTVVKRTTSTTVRVKSSKKKTYWFYVVADSDAGRSERSATTKFPK